MADCDSVSLTRVKPAVRCAARPAPASVVGDQLQQERARGRRGSSSHVYTFRLRQRVAETTETAMPKRFRARIYARRRGRICQVPKNSKLVGKLLEAIYFYFVKFSRIPTSFSKLLEILNAKLCLAIKVF